MTWVDFVAEQWPLVGILAVFVVAFLILESRKGGSTISFHEATRLVNKGEAIILDVRDSSDFKAGHIVDAVNIPYSSLNEKAAELENHKSKQIIVVDKMGQYTGAAGKILRDKGYQVARLQGGITEWTQQSLPLVKA